MNQFIASCTGTTVGVGLGGKTVGEGEWEVWSRVRVCEDRPLLRFPCH